MAEIKDYKCTYDNSEGLSKEITQALGIKFPEAHMHKDSIVILSKALKEHDDAPFCELPFCHTLEAEAMGGIINFGNENTGPRAKDYKYTDPKDLLNLPDIVFSEGRIHEVLLAARELSEQGENVVLHVSGPLTVLNILIDPKYIFKTMRKDPELAKEIFWKIGNQVLLFMKEAQNYGVKMISYADSPGGINILGPKLMEQTVHDFTYDFVKKADEILGKDMLVLLCPKTTFALLGTDKAKLEDAPLSGPMSYGLGCIESIGKIRFVGHTCIKNIGHQLGNGMIKEIKII